MTAYIPYGLLAELTHRCPLSCLHCSNPLKLQSKSSELSTQDWTDVFRQAADLGVIQVHLSGGEPTLREDITSLIDAAHQFGLYTNLITSAPLSVNWASILDSPIQHVQLSFQAFSEEESQIIAGRSLLVDSKRQIANKITSAGIPLTLNFVVSALNICSISDAFKSAVELGASRIEIAFVQFLGWAHANRAILMPTLDEYNSACDLFRELQTQYVNCVDSQLVPLSEYSQIPGSCLGGWGKRVIVVRPDGTVLPCHHADILPGSSAENVRETPLRTIWEKSHLFNLFRDPQSLNSICRSCPKLSKDQGGCRCRAFLDSGDPANIDPVCSVFK